jgi:hypothetical protein
MLDYVITDDVERLHAVLIAAQHYIYSSRQLFKLAQDAFKRAVPPVNSATPRCQKLLDAALELGLQVRMLDYITHLWSVFFFFFAGRNTGCCH